MAARRGFLAAKSYYDHTKPGCWGAGGEGEGGAGQRGNNQGMPLETRIQLPSRDTMYLHIKCATIL